MKYKSLSPKETKEHKMYYQDFCVNIDMINDMAISLLDILYKEYLEGFKPKFFGRKKPVKFSDFISQLSCDRYLTIETINNKNYVINRFFGESNFLITRDIDKELLVIASDSTRDRFRFATYMTKIEIYAEEPYQLNNDDIENFTYFKMVANKISTFIKIYNSVQD